MATARQAPPPPLPKRAAPGEIAGGEAAATSIFRGKGRADGGVARSGAASKAGVLPPTSLPGNEQAPPPLAPRPSLGPRLAAPSARRPAEDPGGAPERTGKLNAQLLAGFERQAAETLSRSASVSSLSSGGGSSKPPAKPAKPPALRGGDAQVPSPTAPRSPELVRSIEVQAPPQSSATPPASTPPLLPRRTPKPEVGSDAAADKPAPPVLPSRPTSRVGSPAAGSQAAAPSLPARKSAPSAEPTPASSGPCSPVQARPGDSVLSGARAKVKDFAQAQAAKAASASVSASFAQGRAELDQSRYGKIANKLPGKDRALGAAETAAKRHAEAHACQAASDIVDDPAAAYRAGAAAYDGRHAGGEPTPAAAAPLIGSRAPPRPAAPSLPSRSAISTVTQRPIPPSLPSRAQSVSVTPHAGAGLVTAGATQTAPGIPPDCRKRYEEVFDANRSDSSEYLSGTEVKAIYIRSGLDTVMLSKVWTLADHDQDGQLSRHEFCVGMWLIDEILRGALLPETLPVSLREPR